MDSINVAGVLQEAGDADSRACTRSQVEVEYFIIPYTSRFIRIAEFCQGNSLLTAAKKSEGWSKIESKAYLKSWIIWFLSEDGITVLKQS